MDEEGREQQEGDEGDEEKIRIYIRGGHRNE
jgi:hypothetical protein